MKIGLFDHVESADRPLAKQLRERIEFVQAAEAAGFFCYHVAEHHCTPLNMTPSPGAYLGAIAQATQRIRLGPLVYLLPLYSPLRIAEEISLLDNLSNGRLQVGVGRGVSTFERRFDKVDDEQSRDIFIEAYRCVVAGLTQSQFSFSGLHFSYESVPMPMKPLQQPFPPFWYGSSNTTGAQWAGSEGMHFTANGPSARAKTNIAAFREALSKRGRPLVPISEFPGETAIGVLRYIVVADSDQAALDLARPAFEHHLANINYLRNRAGSTEFTQRLNVHDDLSFEGALSNGMVIAGAPDSVSSQLLAQAKELGLNYLLAYLFFGTLNAADARRSLDLFAREVMPALEGCGSDPFAISEREAAQNLI